MTYSQVSDTMHVILELRLPQPAKYYTDTVWTFLIFSYCSIFLCQFRLYTENLVILCRDRFVASVLTVGLAHGTRKKITVATRPPVLEALPLAITRPHGKNPQVPLRSHELFVQCLCREAFRAGPGAGAPPGAGPVLCPADPRSFFFWWCSLRRRRRRPGLSPPPLPPCFIARARGRRKPCAGRRTCADQLVARRTAAHVRSRKQQQQPANRTNTTAASSRERGCCRRPNKAARGFHSGGEIEGGLAVQAARLRLEGLSVQGPGRPRNGQSLKL